MLTLVQELKDISELKYQILWLSSHGPRTTIGSLVIMCIPRIKKRKCVGRKEFSWKSHNLYLYVNGHAYLQKRLGNSVFQPGTMLRILLVKKSHRLTIILHLSPSLPILFILYFTWEKNVLSTYYVSSIFHSEQDKHDFYIHEV